MSSRRCASSGGRYAVSVDNEYVYTNQIRIPFGLFLTILPLDAFQGDIVLAAGPMLDEGGKMCGSLVFVRGEEVRPSLELLKI